VKQVDILTDLTAADVCNDWFPLVRTQHVHPYLKFE